MAKVYKIYCDGFSKTIADAADVQAYIDWLRTKGCVGKEVVISVGRGDLKAAVFNPGHPCRREILRAA